MGLWSARFWLMDLMPLVLQVGDRVTGWGQIRTDDESDWLLPAHAVPLMFRAGPGPRPFMPFG